MRALIGMVQSWRGRELERLVHSAISVGRHARPPLVPGLRLITVSNISSGAGSVAVLARPAFTRRTPPREGLDDAVRSWRAGARPRSPTSRAAPPACRTACLVERGMNSEPIWRAGTTGCRHRQHREHERQPAPAQHADDRGGTARSAAGSPGSSPRQDAPAHEEQHQHRHQGHRQQRGPGHGEGLGEGERREQAPSWPRARTPAGRTRDDQQREEQRRARPPCRRARSPPRARLGVPGRRRCLWRSRSSRSPHPPSAPMAIAMPPRLMMFEPSPSERMAMKANRMPSGSSHDRHQRCAHGAGRPRTPRRRSGSLQQSISGCRSRAR